MINLTAFLPVILPKAVAWGKEQESGILATGRVLTPEEAITARGVGVANPENIRVKMVPAIPGPSDSLLAQAATQAGLQWNQMAGLTFFYGVFIRNGHFSRKLLAHECRHVFQYEQRGSIEEFLKEYIPQVLTVGYFDAPLEADARKASETY